MEEEKKYIITLSQLKEIARRHPDLSALTIDIMSVPYKKPSLIDSLSDSLSGLVEDDDDEKRPKKKGR